jgi:hypothetical protein
VNLVPYIDLGWLLVGVAVMVVLLRRRPESVMKTEGILLDAYTKEEPGVKIEEVSPTPEAGSTS